jgi:RNA polymerase sigma factor for flagellar operon FliA
MVDAIRLGAPLPRRMYRRLRQIAAADHLEDAFQEELAAAPPATPEAADLAIARFLGGAATAMALAVRRPHELDETRVLVPEPSPSPEDDAANAQLVAICRVAMESLPERERRVIELFYFEDAPLDVIAKELGVSRSWACRLHLKAVSEIQVFLEGRVPAPAG